MKKFIFFFLMLKMQLGLAQIEFNPSKQILLKGSSCLVIQPLAQAIFDWTQGLNQTEGQGVECYCSKDSCHIDVAPVSPHFVKELTNYEGGWSVSSTHNGPNCFNAALASSQTLPNISFTHPYEMRAILSSSLCKERDLAEQLQAGDLLIVRNQKDLFLEVHAAIYINERLSFSKYGEDSPMPYSYGLDVAQAYGVRDAACLRIKGIPAPDERCYQKSFVNIFSCRPFYSYISGILRSPDGLNPTVQDVYAKVSSLDKKISDIAFKGVRVNKDSLAQLQKSVEDLFQNTEVLQRIRVLNSQNQELVKLLRFRLFSLFEQTRRIAKDLGEEDLIKGQLRPPEF